MTRHLMMTVGAGVLLIVVAVGVVVLMAASTAGLLSRAGGSAAPHPMAEGWMAVVEVEGDVAAMGMAAAAWLSSVRCVASCVACVAVIVVAPRRVVCVECAAVCVTVSSAAELTQNWRRAVGAIPPLRDGAMVAAMQMERLVWQLQRTVVCVGWTQHSHVVQSSFQQPYPRGSQWQERPHACNSACHGDQPICKHRTTRVVSKRVLTAVWVSSAVCVPWWACGVVCVGGGVVCVASKWMTVMTMMRVVVV